MTSYELQNRVRWDADDEAAFWASYPDYTSALPDGPINFRTGYDPRKVPPGAPKPPSIAEISAAKRRAQDVASRIHVQDFPLALPLGPLMRRLGRRIPAEMSLLAQQYAPYLLVYGIDVEPAKGERIQQVRVCVRYDDERQFITHSLAPDTELEERYAFGLDAQQGLDLSLAIAAPAVVLAPGTEISAGLRTDLHGSMLVHWQHRRLHARVVATGVRRALAQWTFNDADELVGRVDLRAVVLAPKRARRLRIAVDGEFRVRSSGMRLWRGTIVELSARPVAARLVTGAAVRRSAPRSKPAAGRG
ncbi:MAG: hypothetical protein JWR63_4584 [Conexibacter sp.]|nr:hypothetical protein [Conexibacter sp.]